MHTCDTRFLVERRHAHDSTVDRLGHVGGRYHIDLRKDIQNLDHPILFLARSEA